VQKTYPKHRLSEFGCLTDEHIERLRALGGSPVELPRHAVIRSERSDDRSIYLLVEGWVLSSLLLRNGDRQILKLHLPGDVLGSTSMSVEHAVDTLTALTPVAVCKVPLAALGELMSAEPRVMAFMLLSCQKERIALMDRLAWVGRSSAIARLASFLLDINERLERVGQARDGRFELRITQEQLGDMLGLTAVHVNRMTRELERRGLVERRGSMVHLSDPAGLHGVAALPPRRMAADAAWLNLA
jgi:CRP/FNR family transcriptional regulator